VSTGIEISLARPGDAKIIAEMSRDLIEKGLDWSWRPKRILDNVLHPDCVVITARTRLKLAGFAVMEFHETHSHLNLLAVIPGLRRKGTGHALLEWLEQSAQVAGIARINLEVRSSNLAAVTFYKAHGYEVQSSIQGYYQGKENAYSMVHHLIAPEIAGQRP
jgi:[ribosomal protein S18]-alanine N-acetyltransferase